MVVYLHFITVFDIYLSTICNNNAINFSIFKGASQYIGDPIECDSNKDSEKFQSVFEDHCWIHGGTRIGHGKPELQKHFGCLIRVIFKVC